MTNPARLLAILPLVAWVAACAPMGGEPETTAPVAAPRTDSHGCPELSARPDGLVQTGEASWYGGRNHHNGPTSSGERYNQHAFTAAHRTLPFDSLVRVTRLRTGESTVVRINDRGPHIRRRIIDVSFEAAKAIGLDAAGIGQVRIEELDRPVSLPALCDAWLRGESYTPPPRQARNKKKTASAKPAATRKKS